MSKYLKIYVVVFGLMASAICEANRYSDAGVDHDWFTQPNWADSEGSPNNDTQDAIFEFDGTICEVSGSSDITCRGIFVGAYGAANTLTISGGNHTCTWLNVGRGADPNSNGTFTMTAGTIETDQFVIPEQFDSAGDYMVVGTANIYGGTINVTTANFGIGQREYGVYKGGFGTLEMKPGAQIRVSDPGAVAYDDTIDALFKGAITAATETAGATAMITVTTEEVSEELITVIQAVDTTVNQANNPSPGSWHTQTYTIGSQETQLDWTTASGTVTFEYLFFGEDITLVTDKDGSVNLGNVKAAPRPYSVGSLDLGKTYYWQVVKQEFFTPYDGQVWRLHIPNKVLVDDFDTFTTAWSNSGSATSSVEDNVGLKYSPYGNNLKIEVGAGLSGAVSSVPAGSDWSVKGVKGFYVDVYGNALNDASAGLTVTLNNTATVVYPGSLQDPYDTVNNTINTWKIHVDDFGIGMNNITKIEFSVDNSGGASDAVVHVADIRLVAEVCTAPPEADVTGDCVVDNDDLKAISADWLTDGLGVPE